MFALPVPTGAPVSLGPPVPPGRSSAVLRKCAESPGTERRQTHEFCRIVNLLGLSHDVHTIVMECVQVAGLVEPPLIRRPVLARSGITREVDVRLTSADGRRSSTIRLHYLGRGTERDVFGNDSIAVKLQGEERGTNEMEAAMLTAVAAKEGSRICAVLWCGSVQLHGVSGGIRRLSCLVMARQGEDLLHRLHSIVAERRCCKELLWDTLRAFLRFFAESWERGVFYTGYNLRRVCVRPAAARKLQLGADDLVLVSVRSYGPVAECRQGDVGKMWRSALKDLHDLLVSSGSGLALESTESLRLLVTRSALEQGAQGLIQRFDAALANGGLIAPVPFAYSGANGGARAMVSSSQPEQQVAPTDGRSVDGVTSGGECPSPAPGTDAASEAVMSMLQGMTARVCGIQEELAAMQEQQRILVQIVEGMQQQFRRLELEPDVARLADPTQSGPALGDLRCS